MAFVYQADIFCDDCGRDIRNRLDAEGKCPADPEDERTYDSDEYPKCCGDDEESDSPQHCGSHDDCLNAHILPSGRKIGCLIGTSLTSHGVSYVEEAIADGGEVAEFWYDEFSAAGYDLKKPAKSRYLGGVCPDCHEPIPNSAEATASISLNTSCADVLDAVIESTEVTDSR